MIRQIVGILLILVLIMVVLCSCAYNPNNAFGWSNRTWAAVNDHQVFVGMTEKQALWSWGQPDDVDTTSTTFGVQEMWTYERGDFNYKFLHFENRKLVTIHK